MPLHALNDAKVTTLAVTIGSEICAVARSRQGSGKLERFLLLCCIAIAGVSPLLLGSAQPVAWLLWAMVIGIMGSIYGVAVLAGVQRMAVPLRWLSAYLWVFGLVCTMLVVQLLPIGRVFRPVEFYTAVGTSIEAQFLTLSPSGTLLMLIRMLSFGLFFFLVVQTTVRRDSSMLMQRALLLIVAGYSLMGLGALTQGDTFLAADKGAHIDAAVGPFVNHNSFATFLSFALVLGSAQLLAEIQPFIGLRARVLWRALLTSWAPIILMCLTIILAALLATQSRMGLLAGMMGVGMVILATALRWQASFRVLSSLVFAGVLGGGLLLVVVGPGLLERVGSLESSADDRLAFYQQVWSMIVARPLTGYGGGSFELAFPLFHLPPVTAELYWDRAHSSYLALWSELGLVAGSLPMLFYVLIAVSAAQLIFKRRGPALAAISTLGCLTVAATHSLVDFSLEVQANALLLLAIVALVPSAHMRHGR